MNAHGFFFLNSFLIIIAAGCMNAVSVPDDPKHVAIGSWGGEHVGLDVTEGIAKLEFDCAHGSIDGLIPLDANDRFDVNGVYVEEQGGPVRQGNETGRAARYFGKIDGNSMSLTVEITEAKKELGTYTLELGKSPVIRKCD
jgi:hypothetical protein